MYRLSLYWGQNERHMLQWLRHVGRSDVAGSRHGPLLPSFQLLGAERRRRGDYWIPIIFEGLYVRRPARPFLPHGRKKWNDPHVEYYRFFHPTGLATV